MRAILASVRVTTIFVSILIYLGHMSLLWFVTRNRWVCMRKCNRLLSVYSRFGLFVLGVRVKPLGLENLEKVRSGLFVGNHLSYMDVLAISSQVPACFVTSQEIKETPFLGQICQMAGCLFVERRNKQNILNEISEIRDGLQLGLNVAIFPEATSTNGEAVLRFRRPLFKSAIDAEQPVIPFCLNYIRVGGQPINSITRDKIFWYGDMGFSSHLWSLANSGGVELDLHFLAPILTTPMTDPTALTEESQRAVEGVFKPVKAASRQ